MSKSLSLMRVRRTNLARREQWFSTNRFKDMHGDLLTSPSYKYLEKQERLRRLEEDEAESS